MKKSLSFLASLMAIALLSCSSDNSNPLAEEMNLPQEQALPNGLLAGTELIPIKGGNSFLAKTQATNSTEEYSPPITKCATSMSVSGVPYGNYAESSIASFNFTSIPAGSTNLAYELSFGSYSNVVGTFGIYYLIIECGNLIYAYNWYGDLYSIGTYDFANANPPNNKANVTCKVSFYGRCNGTAYGGGPCGFRINDICMTNLSIT